MLLSIARRTRLFARLEFGFSELLMRQASAGKVTHFILEICELRFHAHLHAAVFFKSPFVNEKKVDKV